MKNNQQLIKKYLRRFRTELEDNVIPFWMRYSPDKKYGGYFTCLTRTGQVFDDKKYLWLQARQVWMLSKLYNTYQTKRAWLDQAKQGHDFLTRYGMREDGRLYFSLTRDGQPYHFQRKIFSDCFYTIARAEYSRAVDDPSIYNDAVKHFYRIVKMVRHPETIGRPLLSGAGTACSLAVPMILLNVIEELKRPDTAHDFTAIEQECLTRILRHVKPKQKLVLETVSDDGSTMDSPEGRLVNPGHAIEAGWFLLHYARSSGRDDLLPIAANMIDWSFKRGWDKKYGGLYYFLDSGGYSPVQLEWSMKLWWPHCEAIYAFLLLYRLTGKQRYLNTFTQVTEYTFKHFSDPKGGGEWYGYLDRKGTPTHDFKGAPYKGFFHLPRTLLYSILLMQKIVSAY